MRGFLGSAIAASIATVRFAAASSLTPPVLPLVVRNPYLSVWLANARDEPWLRWPMFYEGEEVLRYNTALRSSEKFELTWKYLQIGLSVLLSVPESHEVYPLLGRPQDSLRSPEDHDG